MGMEIERQSPQTSNKRKSKLKADRDIILQLTKLKTHEGMKSHSQRPFGKKLQKTHDEKYGKVGILTSKAHKKTCCCSIKL